MTSDEKVRNAAFVALLGGSGFLLSAYVLNRLSAHPVFWSMSSHKISLWIQIPVIFLVLDFARYACHWASHRYDFLWRFHEIHHATEEISALSAWSRFHLVEGIALIYLLPTLVTYLLGIAPEAFVYGYGIPNALLGGLFAHANFNFPRSHWRLAHLITNPSVHGLHHTSKYVFKNYGIGLMIWDMLFGTFALPKNAKTTVMKFGDPKIAKMGIFRQHMYPFRGLYSKPETAPHSLGKKSLKTAVGERTPLSKSTVLRITK